MTESLSKYFIGVSAKRLRDVEIKPDKSNQHEINGTVPFRNFLGKERTMFEGRFIYLNDNEDDLIENKTSFTWYDSRENDPNRSAEFRLYYKTNEAITSAEVGDLIIIGKTLENELIAIIAQSGSTAEQQLLWLFGLNEVDSKFVVKDLTDNKSDVGFAGRYIMSLVGLETDEVAENYIDELLKLFGTNFPTTKVFSDYARSTVKNISVEEAPDEALMAWLEKEELLFKTLESVIVKERLKMGFGKDGTDVDEFISFSLSVQNRRKSRAGHSFENHLAVIFNENHLLYSKGSLTERNNKPDFLFPNKEAYHNTAFSVELLTMLGVKTTSKDRWRQILSEADKIPSKHLITLEPAISKNQTDEMKAQSLQLVIPKSIIPTFSKNQQEQIVNVSDFIKYVSKKQSHI
jgi:hypothetical protein